MTGWGIIGSGWVAGDFAEGLRHVPGADLVAVCSPRTASRFANRFGTRRHYVDVGDLVSDEEVDVVYVATPNSMHAEHSLAALEAGKPVVCEKPFALTEHEASGVVQEAGRRGLLCVEAMPMRFVPATQKAREVIEAGTIGDVRMVSGSFGHRPDYDEANRYFSPSLGGGALLDVGVYPLSLAVMLLGSPLRVSSEATIGRSGVDEQAAAVLTFEKGRVAVLEVSLQTSIAPEAVISGTDGTIRLAPIYRPQSMTVRRFDEPFAGARPGRTRRVAARLRGGSSGGHVPYEGNGFNCEAAEVMRCLAAGLTESPLMPLGETMTVMRTVDAIRAQWTEA